MKKAFTFKGLAFLLLLGSLLSMGACKMVEDCNCPGKSMAKIEWQP